MNQKQYKVLVLTDHTNHTKNNSVYPLVREMRKHPQCQILDVATKGNYLNKGFFEHTLSTSLYVTRVDKQFDFHPEGLTYKRNLRRERVSGYDVIWLRMPPPLSKHFLDFLTASFKEQLIINDPIGIYETGSKAFLMNFPDFCPPMKICQSISDIIAFKNQFPIVLKPFREYGGKGIVKIDKDRVWEGKKERSFMDFIKSLEGQPIAYLGVQFLENVSQGDKRIIVIDGQIMGASLRLPAADSWLCNVSQGGRAIQAEVDEAEKAIIQGINPTLSNLGIVMYGVDTLVGNDGKRILSEFNTTSIGGLPDIAKFTDAPLVEQGIDLIWEHIINSTTDDKNVTGTTSSNYKRINH